MDYEAVYELYMAAYGNQELARAERLKAMQSLVQRDTDAARAAR